MQTLINDLLSCPGSMRKILEKMNSLQEKLNQAKSGLEAQDYSLSSDITLNPEKYGFPLGSQPERFKLLARVNSHPEHKKLQDRINYLQVRINQCKIDQSVLQMKFEALKCAISSQPNTP